MISLEELFCAVDDFCQDFEPRWQRQLLGHGLQRRDRPRGLSLSEIMTILIAVHQSCYRNFKTYYQTKVQTEWAEHFPGLVSYQHTSSFSAKRIRSRANSRCNWFHGLDDRRSSPLATSPAGEPTLPIA